MADMELGTPKHFPEFSTERFSAICSELKQLYVGITRAKQELFIFDEDETVWTNLLTVLFLLFPDISTNARLLGSTRVHKSCILRCGSDAVYRKTSAQKRPRDMDERGKMTT